MDIKNKVLGFSLIEFIVVMTILAILAAMSSKPMTEGFKSFQKSQDLLEVDWQARFAIRKITREIRQARNPNAITTAAANSITFTDFNGNTITYAVNASNQLTRTNASGLNTAQAVAEGISSLTFQYYDANSNLLATPVAAPSNIRFVWITMGINFLSASFNVASAVYVRNSP